MSQTFFPMLMGMAGSVAGGPPLHRSSHDAMTYDKSAYDTPIGQNKEEEVPTFLQSPSQGHCLISSHVHQHVKSVWLAKLRQASAVVSKDYANPVL